MELIPRRQKILFVDDSHGNLGRYKELCCIRRQINKGTNKDKDWKFCSKEDHYKQAVEWFKDTEEKEESYLIYCTPFYPANKYQSPAVTSSSVLSGTEVRVMVYITRICPVPSCRLSLINPSLTTRAKAILIVIRLEVVCEDCSIKLKKK